MCIRDRCNSAWNQVTQKRFLIAFEKAHTEDKCEDGDDTVSVPTVNKWKDIQHDAGVSYKDFVNLDEDLAVCCKLTDRGWNLVDVMKKGSDGASLDEEETNENFQPVLQIPTDSQASSYVEVLRRFVEVEQNASDAIFQT